MVSYARAARVTEQNMAKDFNLLICGSRERWFVEQNTRAKFGLF